MSFKPQFDPYAHSNPQNFDNVSSSNSNMSFEECSQVAPDLAFRNINEINVSADQFFKRTCDGVIVSYAT